MFAFIELVLFVLIIRQIRSMRFHSHSLFMAIKGNDVIIPMNLMGHVANTHASTTNRSLYVRQVVWFSYIRLNGSNTGIVNLCLYDMIIMSIETAWK